jgi:hypothetical protein
VHAWGGIVRLATRVDRVAPLIEAAYRPPSVSGSMPDHLQGLADAMRSAEPGVRRWHAIEDWYRALLAHEGRDTRHLDAYIAGRDARAGPPPARPPDDLPASPEDIEVPATMSDAIGRPPRSLVDALQRLRI